MSDPHARTLIAFPGAAAYQPGALCGLVERVRSVEGLLSVVDDVSAEFDAGPVSGPLLDPRERDLPTLMQEDPIAFHLAIYAGSLAIFRSDPPPADGSILLGLSLGEITALVAGGAYDVVSGARIVAHRTRLLCERLGDTAALVLEADASRAGHLLSAMANPEVVVAVENTANQTVVCGPADAMEELRAVCAQMGMRATRLATPFASHNPAYQPVSDLLWHQIHGFPHGELRWPVYSPIVNRFYRDTDDLARIVADHIAQPVRLRDALETLSTLGVTKFSECAVRPILAPLIGEVLGQASVVSRPPSPMPVPVPVPSDTKTKPSTKPAAKTPAKTAGKAADSAVSFEAVRDVYVEALGYPPEAFEPETDLEADLGITSMRQTEILGAVLDRFELPELPDSFSVSSYPTLSRVLEFVRGQRTITAAAR